MTLAIASTVHTHSATLRIAGDLVYGETDQLLDAVSRLLTGRPPLRTVRIDCSGLTYCDSAGLAAFLQVHRNASATGAALHLDARPEFLDRILDVAGVLPHLTARPSDAPLRRSAAPSRSNRSNRHDLDSSADEVGN